MDEVKSCDALDESYKSPALWDKTSADIKIGGGGSWRGVEAVFQEWRSILTKSQECRAQYSKAQIKAENPEACSEVENRKLVQRTISEILLDSRVRWSSTDGKGDDEKTQVEHIRPGEPRSYIQEDKDLKRKRDVMMTRAIKIKDFKNIGPDTQPGKPPLILWNDHWLVKDENIDWFVETRLNHILWCWSGSKVRLSCVFSMSWVCRPFSQYHDIVQFHKLYVFIIKGISSTAIFRIQCNFYFHFAKKKKMVLSRKEGRWSHHCGDIVLCGTQHHRI